MKKLIPVTLALAASLAVTSCDDSDSGGEDTWKPESSVPTDPGDDGFTQPGAVLAADGTATVPYLEEGSFDDPTISGSLEISDVQTPVEADPAELPEDLAAEDGTVPYYVTYTVTVTGEESLSGTLVRLTALNSAGDGGRTAAASDFAPCRGSIPGDGSPGSTGQACTIVYVDSDEEVAAVGYESAPDYDDEPVLWDLT